MNYVTSPTFIEWSRIMRVIKDVSWGWNYWLLRFIAWTKKSIERLHIYPYLFFLAILLTPYKV